MARSTKLTDLFLQPASVAHRHYEVCRAYFLEQATADVIAQRFDLHPDSVRAIVKDFAADPNLENFFLVKRSGPSAAPTRDAFREQVIDLRRQGLSIADICTRLATPSRPLSESSVYRILAKAGLAGDGRRMHSPAQPQQAKDGSDIPAVADTRACNLQPGRTFPTDVAGLFLFVPLLLELNITDAVAKAGWPGSEAIPPPPGHPGPAGEQVARSAPHQPHRRSV
jgi:hypothetical protein